MIEIQEIDEVVNRQLRVVEERKGKATYPPDHMAGMQVPKGGSSCASCKFVSEDQKHCSSKNFIAWEGPDKPAGSNVIPLPADEYCSDWYVQKQ